MRLSFYCLAILCLLAGLVACEEVYCFECDYSCEQTCEDACSWYEYNGYYYCSDSYWGGVNYVDCECYASAWVWFFVGITCFLVLLAVCCLPPIGIIAFYWASDSNTEVPAAEPGSYRLYSALNPCLYRNAVSCLLVLSCMFCRPFLILESARMALRRVDVQGTKLHMDAEWADYCRLVWFPTCILNCFTCGFYRCCGFAEKREDEFLDQRTSVEGQPGQPVVFFRAKADWWYRWIAALVTAWTCGLAFSFFYVDLVAKSVGLMNLAGVGATSMMDASRFFTEVWARNCILDCFTCHLYSCLGFAEKFQAKYTDEHLTPSTPVNTQSTPTFANGQVYYGATTPGYSHPPSGPPPVPTKATYFGPDGAAIAATSTPSMDDYSYL